MISTIFSVFSRICEPKIIKNYNISIILTWHNIQISTLEIQGGLVISVNNQQSRILKWMCSLQK